MHFEIIFNLFLHHVDCNQYTMLWSMLDYAAGTVPMTRVTHEDLKRLPEYNVSNQLTKRLKEVGYIFIQNFTIWPTSRTAELLCTAAYLDTSELFVTPFCELQVKCQMPSHIYLSVVSKWFGRVARRGSGHRIKIPR